LQDNPFKTSFAKNIFDAKYSNKKTPTWRAEAEVLVREVCEGLLPENEILELIDMIFTMKFIPAGRYLYYAGHDASFYNNCFCLGAEEDTREEWARITHAAMSCLMCGGGIGVDYSLFRGSGGILSRTGGIASGPIALMKVMNEVGRNVMQGGSRRSAMYASLNWQHKDIMDFIYVKDWSDKVKDLKADDFNFPADLDMTNISVNYDDAFFTAISDPFHDDFHMAREVWRHNVEQMLKTAEPGMSFNIGENSKDTLRNACTEFTSEDDSDVCNLGSVNFANIKDRIELARVSYFASKFLVCGGYRAELPYAKVYEVRDKNRKIGLGLMGLHEWLLKNGYRYEMNPELKEWLGTWAEAGEFGANVISDKLGINQPKKYRAIAPTGTIGILASTTTGIEPLFAVAYKRRYLTNGTKWNYEYVVDATAEQLITQYDLDPESIETSSTLASDPERRIKFQAEVQQYVDMAISSTLNLPAFDDQSFTPEWFGNMLLKYAKDLRGMTCYPDGARGGQPLTAVPYSIAKSTAGTVFDETEERCIGGVCGL
jgi:ribonucleoside-diphosphate reductase alpha chain